MGKSFRSCSEYEGELEVVLIAPDRSGEYIAHTFHDEVEELATEHGLTISVTGLAPAEFLTARLRCGEKL